MISPGCLVTIKTTHTWTYPEYPGCQLSRLYGDLVKIQRPVLCLAVIEDMVFVLDSFTGKVFWLRKTCVNTQKKLK